MRKLQSKLKKIIFKKRFPLIEYKPIKKTIPEKTIQITTAWKGLELIIEDILNNSYKGLLSSGFLLSIFLMTNGVNAILGGFEMSSHITITRGFFKQYFISLGLSLALSLLLLITVAAIIVFEVVIQKIKVQGLISNDIFLLQYGRYLFVILMILFTTSLLYKYGAKEVNNIAFISYGAVFTTLLIILSLEGFWLAG